MFGYGKRTFMTARADRASEYLLGPFPGPAVIEAVGLRAEPPDAYGPNDMIKLALPKGGATAISAFIWNDLSAWRRWRAQLRRPRKFRGQPVLRCRKRL